MPASRSRTEHWRDSLRKVQERSGALEISLDRAVQGDADAADGGADVVWRVRLLSINDDSLTVEPPAVFGASVDLQPDIKLIGAMTIGQNRWMFHAHTLGYRTTGTGRGPGSRVLLLSLPEAVERCTRRSFYRISTANLRLPEVQVWPLLDPTSVVAAETANRLQIQSLLAGTLDQDHPLARVDQESNPDSLLLPNVGPMVRASLLNVSGGGLGLLVRPEDARAVEARPHVWIRLDLRPHIPAPIALSARLAHTHVDSTQCLYAGLAFDFSHNPSHRGFVVGLFGTYIEALQYRQKHLQTRAA